MTETPETPVEQRAERFVGEGPTHFKGCRCIHCEAQNLVRDLAAALASQREEIDRLTKERDDAKRLARHNYVCAVREQSGFKAYPRLEREGDPVEAELARLMAGTLTPELATLQERVRKAQQFAEDAQLSIDATNQRAAELESRLAEQTATVERLTEALRYALDKIDQDYWTGDESVLRAALASPPADTGHGEIGD